MQSDCPLLAISMIFVSFQPFSGDEPYDTHIITDCFFLAYPHT